ncbi:MAG: QueT transporter family protein [Clostridia bacterium]|nr:QueT transporter family protein [Clostridia bacterium]
MSAKSPVKTITRAAVIAALYVVLTYLTNLFGLASGVIQVRFSEALCILPMFTVSAIPGLTLGCILANLLTGAVTADVIFGSLATLLGALGSYALRRIKWLAPLPPVLSNAFIVPLVLRYAYGVPDAYWFMVATVGAGELISICGIGMPVCYPIFRKFSKQLFS